VQAEIEYQIVALGLGTNEIAAIIKDATGATVDPEAGNFLKTLDPIQLDATRKRLSENAGWRRSRTVY
jgi:hypothetical protein